MRRSRYPSIAFTPLRELLLCGDDDDDDDKDDDALLLLGDDAAVVAEDMVDVLFGMLVCY